MIGIGSDLCDISRIEAQLKKNDAFLNRCYTQNEREYLNKKNSAQSAAAMFAAKEAVLKAFGMGLGDIPLKDIEVNHEKTGQPKIVLHDKAELIFKNHHAKNIFVSLSHESGMALAFVVIE